MNTSNIDNLQGLTKEINRKKAIRIASVIKNTFSTINGNNNRIKLKVKPMDSCQYFILYTSPTDIPINITKIMDKLQNEDSLECITSNFNFMQYGETVNKPIASCCFIIKKDGLKFSSNTKRNQNNRKSINIKGLKELDKSYRVNMSNNFKELINNIDTEVLNQNENEKITYEIMDLSKQQFNLKISECKGMFLIGTLNEYLCKNAMSFHDHQRAKLDDLEYEIFLFLKQKYIKITFKFKNKYSSNFNTNTNTNTNNNNNNNVDNNNVNNNNYNNYVIQEEKNGYKRRRKNNKRDEYNDDSINNEDENKKIRKKVYVDLFGYI